MKNEIRKYIAEQLGLDDDETINMLLDSYRDTLAEKIPAMQQALAAADFPALKQAAHAIKGSSANIGAEKIRVIALEIEGMALRQDAADAAASIAGIANLSEQLQTE